MKEKIILFFSSLSRMIRGEVSTNYLIKHGLKVGKNFTRQGGCRIDASYPYLIEIGDDVGLSPDVTILAHDNSLKRFIGVEKLGQVKIGSRVMIGAKSLILPNVIIGDNVIIGAGSVVTKNIPSNVVCAGNPARVICSIEDYINKFNKKINDKNLLDRSFSPLNIDDDRKKMVKMLCSANGGDYCFFKCENYDLLHKL